MEDNIQWKVLRSFSTPVEAHLVRSHLEAEGIPCFLRDEHTIGMNWLYSNVLGGVRLCVPDTEFDRAREILALEKQADTESAARAAIKCPACGSEHIQDLRARRNWATFIFLYFGVPLPFSRRRYRCDACGNEFRLRE